MSPTKLTERIAEASPRLKARIAGVLNLLAILMGILASFIVHGRLSFVTELIAGACNLAVTLLLYYIFRPVNRSLALLAAFFGLAVSTIGALEWHPHGVDIGLISLGFYCLLIGYLIFRSTFLPRILGVLMALAGLAWLLSLSSAISNHLSPYIFAPGILAEVAMTLWLLVMGVNVQRWNEQSTAAGGIPSPLKAAV
jgi:hypothetical protein